MSRIIPAVIAMTGRVTMRGLSRWTEKGGSCQTVQRFFCTRIPWNQVFWSFFVRGCLMYGTSIQLRRAELPRFQQPGNPCIKIGCLKDFSWRQPRNRIYQGSDKCSTIGTPTCLCCEFINCLDTQYECHYFSFQKHKHLLSE
jgi:hypothetical protein